VSVTVPATAPATTPADPPAGASGDSCPQCGSPHTAGDKFCEVCGYDFLAQQPAAAPTPTPVPAPAPTPAPAGEEPAPAADPAPAAPGPPATWQVVVRADRARYDADVPDSPPFPDSYTERVFALTSDRLLIGRESQSRGIHPEIDLAGQPEDTGISRSHATLVRRKDGSYAIVDDGSTNGTYVNDGTDPIARGVQVTLADGDRVFIGAWTVLQISRLDTAATPTD
jgi:hypothetical protein